MSTFDFEGEVFSRGREDAMLDVAASLPDELLRACVVIAHARFGRENPDTILGEHITVGEIMKALGK